MRTKILATGAVATFLITSTFAGIQANEHTPQLTTKQETTVTTEKTYQPIPTAIKSYIEEPTIETTEIIIQGEIEEETYSQEDLYLMAHVINGEAGSDYLSDTLRMYVGSVVLNRVASEDFPDTIEEVIYQKGQYACTWDGNFDREPTEASWEVAEKLLEEGSVLPEAVVFQASFKQGSGVYEKIEGQYFCYK